MADVEHDLARRLRGGFALDHDNDRIRTPGILVRVQESRLACAPVTCNQRLRDCGARAIFLISLRLRCTSVFRDLAMCPPSRAQGAS
jgi:hypothetical protein